MPSMERLRFTSSGTEAVMSAIRLARGATGRDLIVKFAGGYHGHGDSLLVEAGSGLATLAMPGSAGVTEAAARDTIVIPYNDPAAVGAGRSRPTRAGSRRSSSSRSPPTSASSRRRPASSRHLRELTTADGALLIFDEVITGFRLAKGGAQERYGVTPDLTTLGKIIGGGLPVGAYGGRADLMRHIAPEGGVYQAGTLSGHPLSMAAGVATLDLLTPAVYERLEATGAALEAGLRLAAAAAGRDVSISRVGSLLTVFFRPDAPRNGAEALAADREAYAGFFGAMLDNGVLLPPSQFEAWFIGATHGEAEVGRDARRGPGGVPGMSAETAGPAVTTTAHAPAPRPDARFLRATRGEPVDATPVWFMRQAGRALPEYRKIRERATLLEITRDPALCAEVTLQPVRRLGVDAAILFADITTPFAGLGVDFDIKEGVGPGHRATGPDARGRAGAHPVRAGRRRRAAARGDLDHPARVPGAAHRLRRRAVHARLLPRRGRPVARLREHQEAHARAARDVGGAARHPRRDDDPVPARTGRRGRRGRPGVRLLGRRALARSTTRSASGRG